MMASVGQGDKYKPDAVAAGRLMTDDELVEPLRRDNLQEGVVDYDPYADTTCPILNSGVVQIGLNEAHLLRRFVINPTHARGTMPSPSQERCGFRLCKVFPTYDQLAAAGTVPPLADVRADPAKWTEAAITRDPLMQYGQLLHTEVPEVEVSFKTTWTPFLLTNGPKTQTYCDAKIARILELKKAVVRKEFREEAEERERAKANIQTGFEEARAKDIAAAATNAITMMTDAEQIEAMAEDERKKLAAAAAAGGGVEETKADDTTAVYKPRGALHGFKFPSNLKDIDRVQNLDIRLRDPHHTVAVMTVMEDTTGDDDVEPLLIVFGFFDNDNAAKAYMLKVLSKSPMFETHLIPLGEWVNPYDALTADVERSAGSQMGRMINAAVRIGDRSIAQREAKLRQAAKDQVKHDEVVAKEEAALDAAERKLRDLEPATVADDAVEADMQNALDEFYKSLV